MPPKRSASKDRRSKEPEPTELPCVIKGNLIEVSDIEARPSLEDHYARKSTEFNIVFELYHIEKTLTNTYFLYFKAYHYKLEKAIFCKKEVIIIGDCNIYFGDNWMLFVHQKFKIHSDKNIRSTWTPFSWKHILNSKIISKNADLLEKLQNKNVSKTKNFIINTEKRFNITTWRTLGGGIGKIPFHGGTIDHKTYFEQNFEVFADSDSDNDHQTKANKNNAASDDDNVSSDEETHHSKKKKTNPKKKQSSDNEYDERQVVTTSRLKQNGKKIVSNPKFSKESLFRELDETSSRNQSDYASSDGESSRGYSGFSGSENGGSESEVDHHEIDRRLGRRPSLNRNRNPNMLNNSKTNGFFLQKTFNPKFPFCRIKVLGSFQNIQMENITPFLAFDNPIKNIEKVYSMEPVKDPTTQQISRAERIFKIKYIPLAGGTRLDIELKENSTAIADPRNWFLDLFCIVNSLPRHPFFNILMANTENVFYCLVRDQFKTFQEFVNFPWREKFKESLKTQTCKNPFNFSDEKLVEPPNIISTINQKQTDTSIAVLFHSPSFDKYERRFVSGDDLNLLWRDFQFYFSKIPDFNTTSIIWIPIFKVFAAISFKIQNFIFSARALMIIHSSMLRHFDLEDYEPNISIATFELYSKDVSNIGDFIIDVKENEWKLFL